MEVLLFLFPLIETGFTWDHSITALINRELRSYILLKISSFLVPFSILSCLFFFNIMMFLPFLSIWWIQWWWSTIASRREVSFFASYRGARAGTPSLVVTFGFHIKEINDYYNNSCIITNQLKNYSSTQSFQWKISFLKILCVYYYYHP